MKCFEGDQSLKNENSLFRNFGSGVMKMLTIPEEILLATRMTDEELRQEIAVMLYEKEKLTLGQAAQFAGMSQMQFQNLIASRQIPIHYDIEELEQDFETIKAMKRK